MDNKYYRIIELAGNWVVQTRPTNRHNWRFLANGKSPSDVFKHIPCSAGMSHKAKFHITLKEVKA